jgi:hypothetical protein
MTKVPRKAVILYDIFQKCNIKKLTVSIILLALVIACTCSTAVTMYLCFEKKNSNLIILVAHFVLK